MHPDSSAEAGLLVSVRSAAEAEAALAGGAAIIDVKEPSRGPLGRADDTAIAGVIAAVGDRRPVSAALGELLDHAGQLPPAGLAFVKWGLAGCGRDASWEDRLQGAAAHVARVRPGCRVVATAYADWQLAGAPPVEAVLDRACRRPGGVVLLDTFRKRPGLTLLDCLPAAELARLVERCRSSGVAVALAGSLSAEEIRLLLPVRPALFAVRGAACEGGRQGTVSAERVRRLVLLAGEVRAGPREG